MHKRSILIITTLISALAMGNALAARPANPPRTERLQRLPDFSLTGLDGKPVTPSDLHGKVVLLDFWETWCIPCRYQARILEGLWPDFQGKDVRFLAVDVSEDLEIVRRFVSQHPFNYPVVRDADQKLSNQLGIVGLPSLVVIDRSGRIVFQKTGLSGADSIKEVLRKALRE